MHGHMNPTCQSKLTRTNQIVVNAASCVPCSPAAGPTSRTSTTQPSAALLVFGTSRPIKKLLFARWHPIGCEGSLLQQDVGHIQAPSGRTVTSQRRLKAFRCKVTPLLGRRTTTGGAVLLGCWATGRPHGGLAGWASSMERLIPARTKGVPVVLLELPELQQQTAAVLFTTPTRLRFSCLSRCSFRSDGVAYLRIWI